MKLQVQLNTLILLISLGSSILLYLFYDSYFLPNQEQFINDFCQSLDEQESKQSLNYQICYNSFKKSNFIWFNLDGLSWDQIDYLKETQKDDSLIFKVEGPFYRQSGAMHESYLTGKPSKNFIGGEVKGDNILAQIQKANQEKQDQRQMKYFGSYFPVLSLGQNYWTEKSTYSGEQILLSSLCDGDQTWLQYEGNNVYPEWREYGFEFDKEDIYQQLKKRFKFSDKYTFENLETCLKDSKILDQENQINYSTMYYTAKVDNTNHVFSKKSIVTFYFTYQVSQLIQFVANYTSQNLKDTVFIVSSDHGGQKTTVEDNFCNHGCVSDTNQAILIITSPELKGKGRVDKMNYLDLTSTVAQFLKGVNFPLFNQGWAQPIIKQNFTYEILPLHAKYKQLQKAMQLYELEIEEQDLLDKYNDILEKDISEEEQKEILDKYKQKCQKFQKLVIDEQLSKQNMLPIYVFQVLIFGLLLNILWQNKGYFNEKIKAFSSIEQTILAMVLFILFSDNICVVFINIFDESYYDFGIYFGFLATLVLIFLFYKLNESQKSYSSFYNEEKEYQIEVQQYQSSNFEQQIIDNLGIENTQQTLMQRLNYSLIQKTKIITNSVDYIQEKILRIFPQSLNKLHFKLFALFLLQIVCHYLYEENTYISIKSQFQENPYHFYQLPILNYFLFLFFILIPRLKNENINIMHWFYYAIVFLNMIYYDLYDQRYIMFGNTRPFVVTFIRIVTSMLFISKIFNIIWILIKMPYTDKTQMNKRRNYIMFLQIDFMIFLFFIQEDIERIVCFLFLYPSIYLIKSIYYQLDKIIENNSYKQEQSSKKAKPFLAQFFFIAFMIRNEQIIYQTLKGTLSLDINLTAGNKTIGQYQDEQAIYTACIFGISKLQISIITFSILTQTILEIKHNSNQQVQFTQQSKQNIMLILIKIMISSVQLYYNFHSLIFLSLYIWFGQMNIFLVICMVPYIMAYSFNKIINLCRKKQRELLRSNK